MSNLVRLLYTLILCLLPFLSGYAGTTLTYSTTVIKIVPAQETVSTAKKNDDKKSVDVGASDLLPDLHRVEKEFTVEVRPLGFLAQKDFIAHQPFTDREGMMMVIDPPTQEQLKSSNLIGKIDVLFVLEDGLIEKIVPDIDLTTLAEPLAADKPIHAFIFLKAGMAAASDIKPGDHVRGVIFKTHPVVLQ